MDKERMRRRRFILGAVKVTLVIPPAAALAFVGHQVEEGLATSFTGAGLGAAFGAAGGGLKSIEDASDQSSTRIHFLNLSVGAFVGAVGGYVSINFKRVNRLMQSLVV